MDGYRNFKDRKRQQQEQLYCIGLQITTLLEMYWKPIMTMLMDMQKLSMVEIMYH